MHDTTIKKIEVSVLLTKLPQNNAQNVHVSLISATASQISVWQVTKEFAQEAILT
jgi:hypothetical protein